MFKPDGSIAKNIDRLILIHMWATHVAQENRNLSRAMIFAGIGKPSYPLDASLAQAGVDYWQHYVDNPSEVIEYGLPPGEPENQARAAQALSDWYGQQIQADDIIFTVGGLSGLRMTFSLVNEHNPSGRIITPVPYYPYYNNPIHHNNFHFIDVMEEPGYRLTAQLVKDAVEQVLSKGEKISAFLLCDPYNPVGSVMGQHEWKKIAEILKETSADIPIILDEAYAEMVFSGEHSSLLVVAPELKERLIIMRSATKGFSASGERMAVLICFNEQWRAHIIEEIVVDYFHVPKSLQYTYSHALATFTRKKAEHLSQFYRKQVEFVRERLKRMNAQMPDSTYNVESTFYIFADLSALLGSKIPPAAQRALGKKDVITTDEDICYSLLFDDQVMISPLSYFGVDAHKGFVRITCSAGIEGLTDLMDRIEHRLKAGY